MFFKDVGRGAVPKIAVIGCGCSVATEPVAEISHYWNIPQVLIYTRYAISTTAMLVSRGNFYMPLGHIFAVD